MEKGVRFVLVIFGIILIILTFSFLEVLAIGGGRLVFILWILGFSLIIFGILSSKMNLFGRIILTIVLSIIATFVLGFAGLIIGS